MVAAGDPVYADDINDILDKLPRMYVKTGSTSRNTTTTYADDPELSAIPLEVGVFEIQVRIFYTVASTTPKLKMRWAFTGTMNDPIRTGLGPGSSNTAAPDVATPGSYRGYAATSQDAIYNSSTSGAYSSILEIAVVTVTVAGNFSIQWAQQTSNGSNVNVNQSSSVRVTKIS